MQPTFQGSKSRNTQLVCFELDSGSERGTSSLEISSHVSLNDWIASLGTMLDGGKLKSPDYENNRIVNETFSFAKDYKQLSNNNLAAF